MSSPRTQTRNGLLVKSFAGTLLVASHLACAPAKNEKFSNSQFSKQLYQSFLHNDISSLSNSDCDK